MIVLPTNRIITTNGEYYFSTARHPGRSISIEVSGTFNGATVEPGYVSADAVPVFIVDVGDDNQSRPKTAPGRWITTLPVSGQFGVKLTNAGASTSILVSYTDITPL